MIVRHCPRWVGCYVNGNGESRTHYYRARSDMTLLTFVDLHDVHPLWAGYRLVRVTDGPPVHGGSGRTRWYLGQEVE